MAFGVYPDVTLSDARKKLADARQLLKKDVDPSQHKQEMVVETRELMTNSFEAIAREVIMMQPWPSHSWPARKS